MDYVLGHRHCGLLYRILNTYSVLTSHVTSHVMARHRHAVLPLPWLCLACCRISARKGEQVVLYNEPDSI